MIGAFLSVLFGWGAVIGISGVSVRAAEPLAPSPDLDHDTKDAAAPTDPAEAEAVVVETAEPQPTEPEPEPQPLIEPLIKPLLQSAVPKPQPELQSAVAKSHAVTQPIWAEPHPILYPAVSRSHPLAQSAGNDPRPAEIKPQPIVSEPVVTGSTPVTSPIVTDPQPVVVEPLPIVPDPIVAEPEPVTAPVAVEPDPVVVEPLPEQTQDNDNTVDPVDVSATGTATDVVAGRVTTLRMEDDTNVESIRVLDMPEHGNLTVNPDNTLALVMTQSDYTGPMNARYEVTFTDGSTEVVETSLNVVPGTQEQGWGEGNYYMLEADEEGSIIVEHGDNHRKVYVSNDEDALSKADIAMIEGLNEADITGEWLKAHPDYGSSEDMALAPDAGMDIWYELTDRYESEPSSHWLLLERGYEYENLGSIIGGGTEGESALHPVHVTSYGTGARPVLDSYVKIYQLDTQNVVFSDVEIDRIEVLSGDNMIYDNVKVSGEGMSVQYSDGLTIRNSEIVDVTKDAPTDPDGWLPHLDRSAGLFVNATENILIEGSIFDHNGWADDYRYDLSPEGGQVPSAFSHNVYLQNNTVDVTFRDNIVARGASYGAQIRGGGFIEDNVFLDNNAAVNFMGGVYHGEGPIGTYTLFADNLVTSAGHKEADTNIGAHSAGIFDSSFDATLIDNIVAHLADPNNPEEQAAKTVTNWDVSAAEAEYNDTISYNWHGSVRHPWNVYENTNVDGLNTDILDQTTIQNYAAGVLGDPDATISDLMDHLRAQADGGLDHISDADLIIAYFQAGFGISADIRTEAETLRFVPDALGDGIRWDNRLNWSTEDLPGFAEGDSVDLAGNWVNYGGTTTLANMDFGSGGKLHVGNGKLTVEGTLEAGEAGAELDVDFAGQFWTDGYSDSAMLDVDVDGGRFANTGTFDGQVDLTASAGQTILATDNATFDLENGSQLTIAGSNAKVGFDGETGGTGTLRLSQDSELRFVADAEGFSSIEEFRSGAYDQDGSNVASGVNLGLSSLKLDISALAGTSGTHELMDVDALIGDFSDITVNGLTDNQDAQINIDYTADTLSVTLLEAGQGSGLISVETNGDGADAAGTALWNALTAGQGVYEDVHDTEIIEEDFLLYDML